MTLRTFASMQRPPYQWVLAAALVTYGCSLINSPEELKDALADGAGGTPQSSGGGTASGGTASGGETGNTGGNGNAGDTGTGGTAPVVAPTTGLVVIGAEDGDGTRVLAALRATNGAELERITLPVAAIAYDEAPGRYVWFVFTANKFPADPTRTADLEVRRFDDATNSWTLVSKASGLPPPRPDQLVVLNKRLAYLSYKVVSGAPVQALTVLDTGNLTDITTLETRTADANTEYVGLVGTRGSDTDKEATGGALDLMIKRNCGGTDCELYAQPVFVGNNLVDGAGAIIDHFTGTPRFVAARTSTTVYAAMYSTRPTTAVEVRSFPSDDPSTSTLFTVSQLTSQSITGFDLLECTQTGLLRGGADDTLLALHLESGNRQTTDLGATGDLVYGEPFNENAIALGDAPFIRAFQVEPSGTDDLAVNERSLWNPPADLTPLTGATRYPEALECP